MPHVGREMHGQRGQDENITNCVHRRKHNEGEEMVRNSKGR